jgi:hypothetical protein
MIKIIYMLDFDKVVFGVVSDYWSFRKAIINEIGSKVSRIGPILYSLPH